MGAAESQAHNICRVIILTGTHMLFTRTVLLGTLVFFILQLHLTKVLSQFHRECTTNKALKTKICCPTWNGSPCGEHAGHGKCSVEPDSSKTSDPQNSYDHVCQDDRINWPQGYFKHYCQCYGNYSGYNCGECKYGYYGKNCEQRKMLIRKEIRSLCLKEREKFFRYLNLAKTTTSRDFVILVSDNRYNPNSYCFANASVFDTIAWIHHYAVKPILINCAISKRNFAHQGPAFLVWHRQYLLFIERQLQRLSGDEDFSIPYYDWSNDTNCTICTNTFLGSSDCDGNISNNSCFASWRVFCSQSHNKDTYCQTATMRNCTEHLKRSPGFNSTSLPTLKDVQDALKWKDYDKPPYNKYAKLSYRNVVEGYVSAEDGETRRITMHNQVHIYMGGTMAETSVSSNDPMFIVHHSYVDRMLETWISCHGGNPDMYPENDLPGHHPQDFMVPFYPCFQNRDLLQSSTQFGYRFQ